jgi:hypothetical protein
MSHEEHESHGHSVAAWVSSAVMILAAALACLGVALANTPMAIVGGAAFVIGALLWPLLSRMGYGDKNPVQSLYN